QGPWLELLFLHLAGRALRARVEVDDFVQEVYTRALAARLPGPEAGEAALRAYLARIARSCVIDALRSLRAKKRAGSGSGRVMRLVRSDWSVTGAAASGIRATAPGPATLATAADEHAVLMRAFERLSPEHRRVLGLRQFEGLSAAEAARRLGRS